MTEIEIISKEFMNKILEKNDLTFEEAYKLFGILLDENEIKIGAYLTALQMKGITSEEIAGFAKAMRDNAITMNLGNVVDTCGTGGDGSKTINVSTAVSLILSCFTKVAKHGNVSITSKSGSANVYEALNCKIPETVEEAEFLMEKTNFTFLHAQKYHPALKKIMPVRNELKFKTIFNVLGPLANPASPKYQIIGVNSIALCDKVAKALPNLQNVERALVVNGYGKSCGKNYTLDELNPNGNSKIVEYNKITNKNFEDEFKSYIVNPKDFGLENSKIIPCNSPEESAKRLKNVFSGKINEDRNFILMNASAGLYACKIASNFLEGIEIAKEVIDLGLVLKKIEEIQKINKINNLNKHDEIDEIVNQRGE
ncbi:anthranilate phosphoribosyltransferase [Methanococcus voltae]|nr:anthranilate phosphoribosyltransferase [Methanococcus voltae]